MSSSIIAKGQAVEFQYRDQYGRESGIGIVVEVEKDDFYKIVLIEQDPSKTCPTCEHKTEGEWYFTNYEVSLPESKFKTIPKNAISYNLNI